MKQALFLASIVILLISCGAYPCGEAKCRLGFVRFSIAETDTVILKRFTRAGNFTNKIDSFFLTHLNSSYSQLGPDTLILSALFGQENGLNSNYDYEIFLPGPNRVFRITDISEDVRSGKAGIGRPKSYCENLITSYKINAVLVSGAGNYISFDMVK